MKKLLIIGTGGQGKVVLDCALSQDKYTDIAFLTNDTTVKQISEYHVYHECDVLLSSEQVLTSQAESIPLTFLKKFDEAIIAIGNNNVRLNKAKQFQKNGIILATLIHSHAFVSKFAEIQAGTVVFANATVNPFSKVGIACIINTGVVVEHDCIIGDGVHISPNASIAGAVSIDEKSWICIGSSVSNNTNIGANSVVGAGGVVIEDVPSNVLVAGVPATIKKYYENEKTTSYRQATIHDCDLT